MIAGRLQWLEAVARLSGKHNLAALDFPNGTLVLTEAGTKRRASLHLVQGEEALRELDPGGLDITNCGIQEFTEMLTRSNHTLKRALADPHLFSGIGNAYSDEILHRARLSPFKQTSPMTDEEIRRLYEAARLTLLQWTEKLQAEAGGDFPEKVTAFREGMA